MGWTPQGLVASLRDRRPRNRGESPPPTKVTLKHDFGRVSLGRGQGVRPTSGRRPGPQLELWLRCRRRMQEADAGGGCRRLMQEAEEEDSGGGRRRRHKSWHDTER